MEYPFQQLIEVFVTFEKMEAMRVDLTTFKKNIKFSDLTEATLTEFVAYMRDSKVLKTPRKKKGDREDYDQEDLVGRKNSTIEKNNALSMGITPNIVMKWTGHSDYKAMKPYIDIVDSIKASSMAKFDGLI